MADADTKDPATIEREVEKTQDAIGDTVEKIEEKLTPREVTRSLFGDSGSEIVDDLLDIARSNPIPVAMIAGGLIWLLASSDAHSIKRLRQWVTGSDEDDGLIPRSEEPAPIGPPPETGKEYDRRDR